MKSLNENIKILRQNYGLNQVEFANKLNVSKQCVSNWENDNVLPSIEMLIKIANFFNTTTDYLLGRENLNSINIDGLNERQIAHISLLIEDLRNKNQ